MIVLSGLNVIAERTHLFSALVARVVLRGCVWRPGDRTLPLERPARRAGLSPGAEPFQGG